MVLATSNTGWDRPPVKFCRNKKTPNREAVYSGTLINGRRVYSARQKTRLTTFPFRTAEQDIRGRGGGT